MQPIRKQRTRQRHTTRLTRVGAGWQLIVEQKWKQSRGKGKENRETSGQTGDQPSSPGASYRREPSVTARQSLRAGSRSQKPTIRSGQPKIST